MPPDIRPFTPEDYEAIARIVNSVYPDYPTSADELVYNDRHRDPKCRMQRFLAESPEGILGYSWYEQYSAMYHPRRFHIDVLVLPEHRGRGVGAALYDRLATEVMAFNPLTLRSQLRQDYVGGLRFLSRRGYQEELRSWESRLDVTAFDPAPYAGLVERLAADGIRILSFRELASDPDRDRKLYELHWDIGLDMPAPEPQTPFPIELFLERLKSNPHLLPDGYLVAVREGEYVGVSNLWSSDGNDDLYTGDTGVRRPYRRRGIALALKVRALAYAKQRGTRIVKTWNESTNRPMLSINERLGFVKQPVWVQTVRIVQEEPDRRWSLRPIEFPGEGLSGPPGGAAGESPGKPASGLPGESPGKPASGR